MFLPVWVAARFLLLLSRSSLAVFYGEFESLVMLEFDTLPPRTAISGNRSDIV